MNYDRRMLWVLLFCLSFLALGATSSAQTAGTAGTIHGVVTDPTGAVVPDAVVEIHNPVSGYKLTTKTDAAGEFSFVNVPLNPYHLSVSKEGFQTTAQDVSVRSSVPIELKISLTLGKASETVTVESGAADLMENTPTAHTDVDRTLFTRLPIESASSSLSSVVTLATPGVVADSNGLFHPLGEHADTSYSVDNQPITDQQSKVFSNQLPLDSIQSLEVVSGAPPAEFGDKTSLVIRVVTRSGLNQNKPTGAVTASYGSFGTVNSGFNAALGGPQWGNFISASGLNTGRFLDPPEFLALHGRGNAENVFDRIDFQPRQPDSFHLNLGYTRSWFQIPNTFDQAAVAQDQRQLLRTFNIAPGWTHLFSPNTLLSVTAFVRQDRIGYFPSSDPFSDLPATLAQSRHLTNAGFRSDLSYVKGAHNVKAGIQYSHTALAENFLFGVTDPGFNAVCVDANGNPDTNPTPTDPNQCAAAGFFPNPDFLPGLLPFDLTRGGNLLNFRASDAIKQVALYVQDNITLGNWAFNVGLRGDIYRGLTDADSAQPRLGAAYNIKRTNTVLRLSYARVFETPYNENLLLSSSTGAGGLGSAGFGGFGQQPIEPGRRNQFNAGFQQAFGRYLLVDGEYFWKYTQNAYDFGVLFSTPLAFPISWRKSKIDGFGIRINFPDFHGLTAYSVLGHTRSRFFGPEIGGLIFNSPVDASVFRIDHDQAFQQTLHVRYQATKRLPWVAFSWRYDSGLVAGSVPDFATALGLTADQQAAIGLFCGSQFATLSNPIASCPAGTPRGATRIRIPADGTADADTNPPRVAPRHLFDAAVGIDDLFHGDRFKWSLRFTAVNLTNKVALYNFLSTFSGTHFVTPRSYTAEVGFHF
jgi:hypothetical protein